MDSQQRINQLMAQLRSAEEQIQALEFQAYQAEQLKGQIGYIKGLHDAMDKELKLLLAENEKKEAGQEKQAIEEKPEGEKEGKNAIDMFAEGQA